LHAGGDATGAEISRALLAAVTEDPGIEVIEHALVLDALKSESGRVCGVTLHVIGEGSRDGVGRALAKAVILGTGGLGQVFAQTTNPSVSTGDGVALALRAGAEVADVEFIQFHPTVLYLGAKSSGQQPLISEAVRGEGAILLNESGEQFMKEVHPLADLAPRDVVAKAIMSQMLKAGTQHVWLDVSKVANFPERFPNIYQSCIKHGINPETDLIPVAPAAHYASGGVRVDLAGRSSVPGLYACGETACTGVHGANRLASNSLLEGLVFAARIADDIHRTLRQLKHEMPALAKEPEFLIAPEARVDIAHSMSRGAGVIRTKTLLEETRNALSKLGSRSSTKPCVEAWEATNLYHLAMVIVTSALIREETRGSHWREDFPNESELWIRRIVESMDGSGNLTQRFAEVKYD
jgi:L-aspartate oxidase